MVRQILCVNVRASKLSILFNRLSICNAFCGKRLAAIALASNASKTRFIISWEQDCRIKMSVGMGINCFAASILSLCNVVSCSSA